jgi:hypothetical protein
MAWAERAAQLSHAEKQRYVLDYKRNRKYDDKSNGYYSRRL